MNSVNIIGRLGRDPELRTTPSGKSVRELNLAVDDGFGENKKTAWLGVVLWGKTADVAAQYLKKGDRCGISGRLTQDTWDDKETGKKQTKTKITGENLHFLEAKKEGQSERPTSQENHSSPKPAAESDFEDEQDDIPF